MPWLYGELSIDPATLDRRRTERRKLRLELGASTARDAVRVIILDLSETGMQIITSADLVIGESVFVQLPEAGLIEARVIWNCAPNFGCEFPTSIPRGAVSAALLTAPNDRPHGPGEESQSAEDAHWFGGPSIPSAGATSQKFATLALSLCAVIVALLIFALLTAPFSAEQLF
jgi:hypothetical protein